MLESLLALSAAVKVLTETVAGAIDNRFKLSDDVMSWMTLVISVLVGITATEFAGLNMFAAPGFAVHLSPELGILITGVAVAFGSNVLNELFGVLEGFHDQSQAKADAIKAGGTTVDVKASVETTPPTATGTN